MSRSSLPLVLGLVACGGGSSTPDAAKAIDAPKVIDTAPAPDAPVDAAPVHVDAPPPMGAVYRYVANQETVPQTTAQAQQLGLDLDGNGTVDNQFGMVIASFANVGTSTQPVIDTAISHGTTIMLAELQTSDFTNATAAGFMIYDGANPMPPACSGPTDTVCGHHLTGTGTFDIATGTPTDPLLVGNFVTGTLTTPVGDSAMPLPLALGGGAFTVDMIGARTKVTAASASGLTAILAGGIPMSEITNKVYPALATAFQAQVAADCTTLTPPACGCTAGSAGAQALALFDTNHDCTISVTEISTNSLVSSLFAPDLTIDGMPAISIGVEITAVPASFTGP